MAGCRRGNARFVNSRRFGRLPVTSGLPRTSDVIRSPRHVSKVPIALQKAATDDVWPFVTRCQDGRRAGRSTAALTLAIHRACSAGLADQLCELPQILGGGRQEELVLSTQWASQPETVEPQDALEVREEHFNLLPFTPRRSRSALVLAISRATSRAFSWIEPWDLARGHLRTTPGLEFASIAVMFAGPVEQRLSHRSQGCRWKSAPCQLGRCKRRSVDRRRSLSRENVPSARPDLSKTGMCGSIARSLTNHPSISAAP